MTHTEEWKEATTVVIKWCSVMNQASSDSERTDWLLLVHILSFQALPPPTSEGSLTASSFSTQQWTWKFSEQKNLRGLNTVKFLIHILSTVTEENLQKIL